MFGKKIILSVSFVEKQQMSLMGRSLKELQVLSQLIKCRGPEEMFEKCEFSGIDKHML